MSEEKIDETLNAAQTDPIESAESKDKMTKDEVGFGVDTDGFWHFVIHEDKGFDNVLGFMLRMQDVVKAHYIGKARAEAAKSQVKGLIRPENISASVRGVKKGRWR